MRGQEKMTSMQRVLTALSHQEPDRVPLCLLLSMYGAKMVGTSIENYFSKAENVVEGQILMRHKFQNDCYYTFYYASLEMEAWGGKTIFIEDGPPNAGVPIIQEFEDIDGLEAPAIQGNPPLEKILKTTALLKEYAGDEVPIIGVVMSPFSVPIMQMGFGKYLELIYFHREQFNKLMELNTSFCIRWANAQLEAGATGICYFDPLSSPSMIPRETFLETGHKIAQKVVDAIEGPVIFHLASGRGDSILHDLMETRIGALAISSQENLAKMKAECKGKITVVGNLNGITMRNWVKEDAFACVKNAIAAGAKGGGFILADNHGEIPWQVPEKILHWIAEAVREYGKYPLQRLECDG